MATRRTGPKQAAKRPQAPRPDAPRPDAPRPDAPRPAALHLAAATQGTEAAGLCVAAAFAAVSTADGRSYQVASGVALTLIAFGTAAVLAVIAAGLAKARPWSRTPAFMTQLFVVVAGIYLLDGHRLEWAIPALLVAAACLAGLLTPASLRALNRPPAPAQPAARRPHASAQPAGRRPPARQPARRRPGQ